MQHAIDFNVRLVTFRYFVAVAESSSFPEAASVLHDNADNVRRGINELERWTNRKLIERKGKITLTEEGYKLLPYFKEICDMAYTIKSSPNFKATYAAINSYSDQAYKEANKCC